LVQRKQTLRRLGMILFSIAILLGLLLTLLRAVPDFEASQFGFYNYGYPKLVSLSCPVLMTVRDQENVTIQLHNTLNRNLKYYVESQISSPLLIDSSVQHPELAPGEIRKLTWQVREQNIVLGNFIFARVFTSASIPNGRHESTCGTVVLNLPFKGGPELYYALLFLTVLSLGVGLWLWFRYRNLANPAMRSRSAWMILISVVIVVGLVLSVFHIWFVALLTVFLALLGIVVFVIPQS
jgi:hypothetical protein